MRFTQNTPVKFSPKINPEKPLYQVCVKPKFSTLDVVVVFMLVDFFVDDLFVGRVLKVG